MTQPKKPPEVRTAEEIANSLLKMAEELIEVARLLKGLPPRKV